ncbi:MAG: hypothetical protein QOJ67_4275 [Acidimicrobiaceae bacterium]|jgi:hypothetical protein
MPFIDEDIEVRACAATDWEVLKPIRYMGSREGFIVHEGFQTDFASVPRALVWLIPKYGKFTAAAILHDFLWEQCRNHKFQWSDADGIFRRAMHEDGVPFVHRWLMWGAVRLGAMKHAPADPFTNGRVDHRVAGALLAAPASRVRRRVAAVTAPAHATPPSTPPLEAGLNVACPRAKRRPPIRILPRSGGLRRSIWASPDGLQGLGNRCCSSLTQSSFTVDVHIMWMNQWISIRTRSVRPVP